MFSFAKLTCAVEGGGRGGEEAGETRGRGGGGTAEAEFRTVGSLHSKQQRPHRFNDRTILQEETRLNVNSYILQWTYYNMNTSSSSAAIMVLLNTNPTGRRDRKGFVYQDSNCLSTLRQRYLKMISIVLTVCHDAYFG